MPLNLAARPTATVIGNIPFSRSSTPQPTLQRLGRKEDPSISEGRRLDNEWKKMRNEAFDPEEQKRKEDFSRQSHQDSLALSFMAKGIYGDKLVETMSNIKGVENPEQYRDIYDMNSGTLKIPINDPDTGELRGNMVIQGQGAESGALQRAITPEQFRNMARTFGIGAATGEQKAMINGITGKLWKEQGLVVGFEPVEDPYEEELEKQKAKTEGHKDRKAVADKIEDENREAKYTNEKDIIELKSKKAKELEDYKNTLKKSSSGKPMTEAEKLKFNITISNIEDSLLNPEEGEEDPTSKVDMFNEYSNKDYYYQFTPEVKTGWLDGKSDEDAKLEKLPRRKLSPSKAGVYLNKAQGDRKLAERLARRDGYKF